jgi:hypothetical protein
MTILELYSSHWSNREECTVLIIVIDTPGCKTDASNKRSSHVFLSHIGVTSNVGV